jgi:hypothetical protein
MTDAPRSVALCFVLIFCFASVALADDFKTINGKEYKNAKVSRVEPDGIVLATSSGISKVYFTELQKEVQQRFHYDAAQAAQFTAATQTGISQNNATVATQQALAEQRRNAEIQQQEQAEAQQRQQEIQQEQIAAQQEQRQLEAQQKEAAKIAAQNQARKQQQGKRRTDAAARANIEEDVRGHREDARENLRYQIEAIKMDRSVKPLSKEQQQTLRTLESERDSIPH